MKRLSFVTLFMFLVFGCQGQEENYFSSILGEVPALERILFYLPPKDSKQLLLVSTEVKVMFEGIGLLKLLIRYKELQNIYFEGTIDQKIAVTEEALREFGGCLAGWRDFFGLTPLMYAAIKDNLELFKYLEVCGANLSARDNEGWNAWIHSLAAGNNDVKIYVKSKCYPDSDEQIGGEKDKEDWYYILEDLLSGMKNNSSHCFEDCLNMLKRGPYSFIRHLGRWSSLFDVLSCSGNRDISCNFMRIIFLKYGCNIIEFKSFCRKVSNLRLMLDSGRLSHDALLLEICTSSGRGELDLKLIEFLHSRLQMDGGCFHK